MPESELNQISVDESRRKTGRNRNVQTAAIALGLRLFQNIVNETCNGVPLPVDLNLTCLDSSDMSGLVDKTVQPLGFLVDDCDQLVLLRCVGYVGGEQCRRCRPYRRQRCLEFMRKPVQQRRLEFLALPRCLRPRRNLPAVRIIQGNCYQIQQRLQSGLR